MQKILFITSAYRTGKKTYPILPHLASRYKLHILFNARMSKESPWYGPCDPRPFVYSLCKNATTYQGIPFGKITKHNIIDFLEQIYAREFDLIMFDDNMLVNRFGATWIYDYFYKHNKKIVACPHGNTNYDDFFYGKEKEMSIFVFGPKDKRHIRNKKSMLICGGVPENDALKYKKHQPQYILFIMGAVSYKHKNILGFKCFTPEIVKKTGIFDLCRQEKCELIIKCKTRRPSKKQDMKDYECLNSLPAQIIFDAEDDNELVAKSKYVISAPSTMTFKSIQMGIPTVVLREFGQIGSLINFSGLCSSDKKSVIKTLEKQIDLGKQIEFIDDTLTGGLEFNATNHYLNAIENILN